MVKLNSILWEQNVTFVNNLDLYIKPRAYQFNLLKWAFTDLHHRLMHANYPIESYYFLN